MNKEIFLHAKDWIITNQKNDGAICWDEKGKFDAWDHSECLLALAIFEEWANFDKGLEYVCLLYTSPSPRDRSLSRMPSSA